jgi:hypothetical protein
MHFSKAMASAICPPVFFKKIGAAGLARVLMLLLLAAGMAAPAGLHAQSGIQREYEIKAAYLYNFINYIEWPAEASPTAGGTLTIGIVGESPFSGVFSSLNGKQIKGRTLAVKPIASLKDADACQIVFVFAPAPARAAEVLDQLKDARALTVGEEDGFAARGGVINFTLEHNKVRFEINPDAAKRQGLNISSELLKLAKLVKS